MWAWLDFVCKELIGWFWFASGGSHVSDRLTSSEKEIDAARGRGSYSDSKSGT